jgi:tRNA pseudouridine38-40 synthase
MQPGWLRFEIEANAFCHQMVRSIVGTLVEIGQGRRSPAEMMARLRSGSRQGAAKLAPPEGLCLIAVRYRDEQGGEWC